MGVLADEAMRTLPVAARRRRSSIWHGHGRHSDTTDLSFYIPTLALCGKNNDTQAWSLGHQIPSRFISVRVTARYPDAPFLLSAASSMLPITAHNHAWSIWGHCLLAAHGTLRGLIREDSQALWAMPERNSRCHGLDSPNVHIYRICIFRPMTRPGQFRKIQPARARLPQGHQLLEPTI